MIDASFLNAAVRERIEKQRRVYFTVRERIEKQRRVYFTTSLYPAIVAFLEGVIDFVVSRVGRFLF